MHGLRSRAVEAEHVHDLPDVERSAGNPSSPATWITTHIGSQLLNARAHAWKNESKLSYMVVVYVQNNSLPKP